MGGKWLELLKEIASTVKRAAMIFNPDTAPGHGSYYLSSFETAARSLNVESITATVSSDRGRLCAPWQAVSRILDCVGIGSSRTDGRLKEQSTNDHGTRAHS